MVLFPLLFLSLVVLYLALHDRAMKQWARHPGRPWNIQRRLMEESAAWHAQEYEREKPATQELRKARSKKPEPE